jgi:hypothetical protein
MVEAPDHLRGIQIPKDHLQNCKCSNTSVAGNAAGNLHDPLNLNGSVTTVPLTSYGYVFQPTYFLSNH